MSVKIAGLMTMKIDKLRVVPFNLAANDGLQFPVLAHQALERSLDRPSWGSK